MRIFSSVLFSALVPTFLILLLPSLVNSQGINLRQSLALFLPIYVASFAGLLIIGLPIYYALKQYKLLSTFNLALSGALAGVIYFLFLTWLLLTVLTEGHFVLEPLTMLWGCVLGLITAAAFGNFLGLNNRDY
ncbi:hypothetical protein GCM10009133_08640 [Cocleimonas flava]|uniref:Uncharacterized protein n=1 Tax=Cocleimonas flava TaxID=634765 RepID=A0A4R1EZ93_9GAMM|nr:MULTISPECIES: hypothetical protein [Cocleimonas]MEB8431911.1 hypothetical protein [Cocleimonas sp. KMM 6892]MEC4715003.1 hypothetical protein [Cocleimonas sp. KMM 6895]MEC4744183.1 hypothetical protein [Cocleimonas sp. KMM 6896]TCJ87226.1 hypothetical protein EV695_1734 [Cocleimonas flava]